LQGLPKSQRKPRAEELIERVDLTYAASRRVGDYSGGMKRRLDLALALVHHPRILFLDEPTTGLDPQSRSALWEEVARLVTEEGIRAVDVAGLKIDNVELRAPTLDDVFLVKTGRSIEGAAEAPEEQEAGVLEELSVAGVPGGPSLSGVGE